MPTSTYSVKLIVNCARCEGTHHDLMFRSFTHPSGEYTHFAKCPTNEEPILMVIENATIDFDDEDRWLGRPGEVPKILSDGGV